MLTSLDWWQRLQEHAALLSQGFEPTRAGSAEIAETAILRGAVSVGERTKICDGAFIQGPVQIGDDCFIGNNAMIRGPVTIGNGSKVGFSTEIKGSIIGEKVMIGPLCFLAESVVDDGAYLGAVVRTSNHRLDGRTGSVVRDGRLYDTGMEKLGCHIGAGARLGIMVVIYPGRVVAPGSQFDPRITITKNLPPGRYSLVQELNYTPLPTPTIGEQDA